MGGHRAGLVCDNDHNLPARLKSCMHQIILSFQGWEKIIQIDHNTYLRGYLNVIIEPPLDTLIPRDMIPENFKPIKICFVKSLKEKNGMTIWNN